MTRISLGIEYDGYHFHGWQKQPELFTIQGCLEEALSKIADEPVEVICAGRTDAGVHAIAQVAHFDTNAARNMYAWMMGANTYLPLGITVHWAQEMDDSFHARYSALSRTYQYIIYNNPVRPAILSSRVTWFYQQLDIPSMQEAAHYLLGENDFSSFRSAECQSKTPMRNIKKINIRKRDHFIIIEIQANAFLHHMVRNIVGLLKKIGTKHEKPLWAKEVLEAKDRRRAGETAPPEGLYLASVEYPEKYSIQTFIPIKW